MVNGCKIISFAYNSQITTTLGMSPYEMVFNQKPRKPIMFTANSHKNAQGYCQPNKDSICYNPPLHTHDEDHFHHPQNLKYHKLFQNKKLKAAPNNSHFFLTRVKFLVHNIERNTITPLKSRIDAIQKLQPPTNKKKIQEFLGMLNFFSKYVYKMQLYLRPFYNILRQQNNFEWTTEHQTRIKAPNSSIHRSQTNYIFL